MACSASVDLNRRVQLPFLGALSLEDENINIIVVRRQPLRVGRRKVRARSYQTSEECFKMGLHVPEKIRVPATTIVVDHMGKHDNGSDIYAQLRNF